MQLKKGDSTGNDAPLSSFIFASLVVLHSIMILIRKSIKKGMALKVSVYGTINRFQSQSGFKRQKTQDINSSTS